MGVVTIHVFNDAAQQSRNAAQDYHCEVKLLLKHMQYFKPFLQGLAPGQDTEIAVQCNLTTFDWLMSYVKAKITGVQPVLDCSNCIPIVVACSYLKMTQLLREAVQFIAANILQLAAAGADIAGLDSAIVTKIAKATSEEALEALLQLHEGAQLPSLPTPRTAAHQQQAPAGNTASSTSSSSNALLQKLYKHKLEALLKEHNTTLLCCQACQQLFSAASHHKLQCAALAWSATERLRALPLHQPDPAWRFQDFLRQQRQQAQPQQQQAQQQLNQVTSLHGQPQQQQQQQQTGTTGPGSVPWRDLYYLSWGHVTVLYCTACHQHFPGSQYSHCSFHPLAPVFASEVDAGQYPCCGRPAWRPGLALAHSRGCCATQHQVALQQQPPQKQQQQQQQKQQQNGPQEGLPDAAGRALQLLQRFGSLIIEPYAPPLPQHDHVVAPAAAATAAAEAAAAALGASSNGMGCSSSSGSSNSRPASRGATGSLPLLVRMTNRSSPCTTAGAESSSSSRLAVSPHIRQDATATCAGPCSQPGTAVAAAQQAALHSSRLATASNKESKLDPATAPAAAHSDHADDGADVLDEAGSVLDYRSAHLRSFMEAVHAAAGCRDSSSKGGLDGGALGGRLQGAVSLSSTFSAAGTAGRQAGRQSMLLASGPQQRTGAALTAASSSRQQGGPLAPSRGGSRDPGHLSSASSSSHGTGLAAAAAAAADVQASRVNRTLLLELMHEDDVYRMGLLMRKLDAARLQPPPDGTCSSRSEPGMLSEVDVSQATNSVLFTGVAATSSRSEASKSVRLPGKC